MGGTSVPTLSAQIMAIWHKSIGPEGPPTKARPTAPVREELQRFSGRDFSPDAFRSGHGDPKQKHRA
ncbi:DUF6053 domain-containing protein [Lysobacter enzymogenes]|uniref:DUF6053 domain-containing protein n=1 Tax=Lysobacter enzymogenes TaxID=69 RepID=UPI003D2F79D6